MAEFCGFKPAQHLPPCNSPRGLTGYLPSEDEDADPTLRCVAHRLPAEGMERLGLIYQFDPAQGAFDEVARRRAPVHRHQVAQRVLLEDGGTWSLEDIFRAIIEQEGSLDRSEFVALLPRLRFGYAGCGSHTIEVTWPDPEDEET